jgi:cysteine synthase
VKIIDDYAELVGRTPLLRLRRLFPDLPAQVVAKLELTNPMSVKDRPVRHIIEQAIADGTIQPGVELVEASSGNTAIAIAMYGAARGFPVRIFMSELCSVERFQILNAFGAKVMLTPGAEHTRGARARAIAWCEQSGGRSWFVNQHSNPSNGDAHYRTTGLITENFQRGRERLDELVQVPDDAAFAMTRRLARTEGILAGVTSGASLWVAEQLARRPEYAGKTICCIICDSGERYLSVEGLFPADDVTRVD